MVYANQQAYYDVITESSILLNEIFALKAYQAEDTENVCLNVGINERNILIFITNSPAIAVREMAEG